MDRVARLFLAKAKAARKSGNESQALLLIDLAKQECGASDEMVQQIMNDD